MSAASFWQRFPIGPARGLVVALLLTIQPLQAAEPLPSPTGLAAMPNAIRAQLVPRQFTTLSAEVAAKVEKLPFREGERFKKGDTLILLDCAIQKSQLEKARAVYNGAEKNLATNRRLLELKSVGALDLSLSESKAGESRAEVNVMSTTLNKCTVSATFSGRVVEQKVREQQFVQTGQPILEILDDQMLELELIVPSRWLAWLGQGTPFQVVIDETGRHYPVKVARVGARVDPVSQSVKVIGEVVGQFPELIAGMSGKAEITPPAPPP
ncbi:MAG: efflux RND transporter periplasmic adaptor subunit [Magnetococcales bacterium]|nr:efflux RND transporter periplasmic adaptor subunit [Magnetococcales bacterium]